MQRQTLQNHLLLRPLPLWLILTAPFITIIMVAVTLTSYLSLQNSQATINNIAEQLLDEINARIETHLHDFLETPHLINQSTADAIQRGELDSTSSEAVQRYTWEEVQIYRSVTSIYFGNTRGGLVSGGREGADGSLYVMFTPDFAAGTLTKYATDHTGKIGDVLITVPKFDARVRPWYIGAIEQQGAYWTTPYVLSTGQDLAVAASLPVYDPTGNLLGVTSVDIFLSHIGSFLQNFKIGQTGKAYIVEQSGLLIASSTDAPLIERDGTSNWRRLPAVENTDPVTAASARYILNQWHNLATIETPQQLKFDLDGERHYLWVTPYHDPRGLDWFIVVIIPEDDFFSEIKEHNQITILLTILAISFAVLVGIVTALQVSRPISRLSQAASAIAKGNWQQSVPLQGVQEVRQLGDAFNTMSMQLQEAFSHLEKLVQERTQELTKSEARYRAIVEDQTELICRFLPDNTLTFVNEAYCRYFDKTRQELLGKSFMPKIPPEDQPLVVSQFARLGQDCPAVTVEHRVILPDDSFRWMQWVNRALLDDAHQIIEIQAVGRDITERIQFEHTLQKALAHETELNKFKTHFISTVSHEFRTPMAAILNASETLEKYHDRLSPEKQMVYFQRIKNRIYYMTALLQDVLTINRAEHGKLEFTLEELDIMMLFQSVINEIRVTAEKPFTVEYEIEESCTTIVADKNLLRLITANLISNAVKYSLPDSTITITLNCTPTHIVFSIQDEGIGIPSEAQSHVFEPFFRADNVDMAPGTGLGLAIVKRSIEQHAGTITFESTVGQGTTFTVTLPNNLE